MRKGFTLIELLVVIGIFGILLSTFLVGASGARRSGRDNLRIADLKAVQQGLGLYYLKCHMYPGMYDASLGCLGGLNPPGTPNEGPPDWATLVATLSGAPIGFGEVPSDPLPVASYQYWVQLGDGIATPRAQCYVLRAQLETDHRFLENDLENTNLTTSLLPTGSLLGAKNLYPLSLPDCDDTSGSNNYCVGNIECFHGL